MIKTRFAPSPTGFLHIGGLRTALYSFLIAKKQGGKFVLRIEDTDRERYVEGGIKNILKSMYWAKIIPDEGVILNEAGKESQIGENGPYVQSQRLDIYKKHVQELLNKHSAYYCFCSSERLDELRKYQQRHGLPTGYDGLCRTISKDEARKRVSAGEKHIVRMRMPKEGETIFNDLIRGEIRFKNDLVDDQVILKSDGYPTYHLAVVVDDHFMGITHVIRGEEWLSSVPKHLQLFKYFGWELPQFAHLPLILNPDKTKLSKRQGDVAVEDYIKAGYLPEAIINFVVFLGWNPGDERELFALDDMINEFDISKVGKAGAVFNIEKLNWFNKQYLKKLSNEEFLSLAMPFLIGDEMIKRVIEDQRPKIKDKDLEPILNLERERVTTLAELPEAIRFAFKLPDYEAKLLVWKKSAEQDVKKILSKLAEYLNTFSVQYWNAAELQKRVGEWIQKNGFNTGSVLWPFRVALSGQDKSPGPFEIAAALGKGEALKRIDYAISKI